MDGGWSNNWQKEKWGWGGCGALNHQIGQVKWQLEGHWLVIWFGSTNFALQTYYRLLSIYRQGLNKKKKKNPKSQNVWTLSDCLHKEASTF